MIVEGYGSMLSGIKNSFSKEHMLYIDEEIGKHGGSKKIANIDCLKLSSVFNKYQIKKIDFLSIDTEGHEIQVLNGIDFGNTEIELISIELDYTREKKVEEFLKERGFERILRIQTDILFRKKSL